MAKRGRKSKEQQELDAVGMLVSKPNRKKAPQWWEKHSEISRFLITFYREHQKFPSNSQIAKGVGIDMNTVTAHLSTDNRGEVYRRVQEIALSLSEGTVMALYNSAIKGNSTAALSLLALGAGISPAQIIAKNSPNMNVNVNNTQNNVSVDITTEEQLSIEDKIAKYQRSKERDKALGLLEDEVINAHNTTKE